MAHFQERLDGERILDEIEAQVKRAVERRESEMRSQQVCVAAVRGIATFNDLYVNHNGHLGAKSDEHGS